MMMPGLAERPPDGLLEVFRAPSSKSSERQLCDDDMLSFIAGLLRPRAWLSHFQWNRLGGCYGAEVTVARATVSPYHECRVPCSSITNDWGNLALSQTVWSRKSSATECLAEGIAGRSFRRTNRGSWTCFKGGCADHYVYILIWSGILILLPGHLLVQLAPKDSNWRCRNPPGLRHPLQSPGPESV